MKLYFSSSYPDDDGEIEEAKSGLIFAKKEDLLELCSFFDQIKTHLESHDNCHMHLMDFKKNWIKGQEFDLEVSLIEDE